MVDMKSTDCIKWIWKASKDVRGRIALSSLAGMLYICTSLAFVWFCKELVDIATSKNTGNLGMNIAGMAICLLLQIVFSAMETRLNNITEIILKNKLRYTLFTGLMESKWFGKESFHSGDSMNRITEDVRVVADAITKSVPTAITASIQFLAAFTFLFLLEPALAWAIPGLMLTMLTISKAYIKRMRSLNSNIRESESHVHTLMQESLQHRITINSFEQGDYIKENLTSRQSSLLGHVIDKTRYSIFTKSFVQAGFFTGYAAAFLWGVFGIIAGTVTFGTMTAFLQLVGQIQRPIINLAAQLPVLINSITSAERLAEILSLPKEESGDPVMLQNPSGICFNNVTYSYPDSSKNILTGFSYNFAPGSTTALMGETGAGKSTLMRLALGLLDPNSGSVSIYDKEQSLQASSQTRCNIIYVPQGNTLMSGTIRENLLLGNPLATDEQIQRALHSAAADFVLELPNGLETICGEKGAGLSEGQAQRVAIARALLRKGNIILLDEPTASLDSDTEEILLTRLTENLDGKTLIIVTHRRAASALCSNTLTIQG